MLFNDPRNAERLKNWKPGGPMINEGDYWPDENYVAPDKEKETLVLKLATLITDRYVKKFTHRINTRDPEYWALDHVLTKDEVKFLLSLKKTRVPYTTKQLAEMNGMSLEEYANSLNQMDGVTEVETATVNGLPCVTYRMPQQDTANIAFTTQSGSILEVTCWPLSVENADLVWGAVVASIQPE